MVNRTKKLYIVGNGIGETVFLEGKKWEIYFDFPFVVRVEHSFLVINNNPANIWMIKSVEKCFLCENCVHSFIPQLPKNQMADRKTIHHVGY